MLAVLGGALTVVRHSDWRFQEQVRHCLLEEAGRRLVDRLHLELRSAKPATFLPLVVAESEFVQFRKVGVYRNGAVELEPAIRLEIELSSGESRDGRDDNGNGLADKGSLVLTEADGNPPAPGGECPRRPLKRGRRRILVRPLCRRSRRPRQGPEEVLQPAKRPPRRSDLADEFYSLAKLLVVFGAATPLEGWEPALEEPGSLMRHASLQ